MAAKVTPSKIAPQVELTESRLKFTLSLTITKDIVQL
jgi:hypothetical protein